VPIVLKFGSLIQLEPSGPVKAWNGIAFPLVPKQDKITQLWKKKQNLKKIIFQKENNSSVTNVYNAGF
jgi:hypothetical protein